MDKFKKLIFNKKQAFIVLYLLINTLFVYKYGMRQTIIPVFTVILVYVFFVLSIFYLFEKTDWHFLKKRHFLVIVFLFFIATIAINIYVDGNSLNVDRWSAMDVGISKVLNGEYPYNAKNHLGQYSSNLPSLMILGLPFYFLGDVGYLQSATFLLLSYLIFLEFKTSKLSFLILFLFISSPAYLYEIYVKSDLLSNLIFAIGFIIILNKKYHKNLFSKPYLIGFFAAFLLFTRVILVIPLTIFLFQSFAKTTLVNKIKFLISGFITLAILSFLVLMNCPDTDTLIHYNPFILQGNKSPLIINILALVLPFLLSFRVKNLASTMAFSFFVLALPVLSSFFENLVNQGLYQTIIKNSSDITYIGMLLPFVIFYITYQSKLAIDKYDF